MKQESLGQNRDEILFVGIDLGTSRSAISASNGKKMWVESYVGWPKDFIALKVLKKPVLFGKEAIKNRLSLDIYRPLERGVIKEGTSKDEESVKELIRHLIELVEPEEGQRIYAIVGVPAESLKINKLSIKKAVSEYVDSLMVVSEPFAVAYGLDLLNNAMIIDIGAGTVDFCIMHGTIPTEEDQRTLFTAGDYIDQQLFNYLVERYPESYFNIEIVRQFKEKYSFVGDINESVNVEIPVRGRPVLHDITEEMKRACESILPAIIETAVEMIAKVDPEYQPKIRNNIVLAGGGSQIRGIDRYIHNALKEYGPCNIRVVEDPLFAGADGALALAKEMPQEYWERV